MPLVHRKLAAEFFGTFALVFAGTGAIIADNIGGKVTHVGVALTFGLVVMAMIYAFGDVSGAHFNPAVTLGCCTARRMDWREAPGYMAAQCSGAVAASFVLRVAFSGQTTLGATHPSGGAAQSLVFETLLTWLLMLVILSVSTGAKEKGITAGIAIGGVIALEALFAGPICGASMNPARSLAPALVGGDVSDLWIYLIAPAVGALLAVPACCAVQEPGCCSAAPCGGVEP